MMTCRELDRLITPFVDDECSPAERAGILTHLQQCPVCRTRVEAEATARNVLRAHAAVARTVGESPPWRPRVFRLGQPAVRVHPALLFVFAFICVGLVGLWLRPTPVLAVGVIGDSFCERDHRRFTTVFNASERECVLGCVKGGAEFVLVTDTQVYRIRNQQLPELAAFANRRVKVEGKMEDGRILVAKMVAIGADDAGAADARRPMSRR